MYFELGGGDFFIIFAFQRLILVRMNIRKYLFIGLMALALSAGAMTDDEVIRYIRTQSANGKTEKQIGQELMARGVKPDQVRRIKAKYQREGSMGTGTDNSAQTAAVQYQGENYQMNRNQGVQTNRNQANQTQTGDLRTVGDDSGMVNEPDYIDAFPTTTKEVYGHSLFNSQSLSFEPNNNMATPKNYRLGPGDEVIIDIWGAAEEHLREKISPEGSIMVSRLGPVYLNGKTVDEANKYIKNLFANKYGGLSNEQTDVSVNLGDIRSIQIDIMGEVSTPGSFRMSPFSSVFHALYNAGGINDIGSMRNIYVLRNGKRVATVDIYDYLFKGKQTGNIRLQEGDVIIVPPYEQIVNVSGNVKRPMYYEIKPGETVASLLDYAGGLSGDAYSGMVQLSRQNGTENELYNVEKGDFDSYRLKDGDVVTVGTVLDRFSNRVELKGAVTRPGLYALGSGATTLTEMLRLAEGLTDDAYKGRALIYRQGPDMTFEVIPVNLGSVMAGISPDITLQKNDIVEIASVQDISEKGDFTINGMVTNPGAYSYMANTSVEDLILRAGGLREGASTARVDVSRRIVDPAAMTETNQLAQTYTINIVGGLGTKNNPASEFMLKPYDIVTVRTAPGYQPQEMVEIDGQVLFGGTYTISKRNERLSDLVARAGGIVDGAYVRGAFLKRKISDDERQARENVLKMAMMNQEGADSISTDKIEVSDVYSVGINLELALAYPGSAQDLVLQPGDKLYIPEQVSTVKISGEVMYPNTVVYQPGLKVSDYIKEAGGYGNNAKKSKCFIVYLNGHVDKVGRKTVVEPGAQIIVPAKEPGGGFSWEKALTFISGFGSVATMAATIASLFKK